MFRFRLPRPSNSPKRARDPRRQPPSFRPRLEGLESRRLLSTSGLITAASSTNGSPVTLSFGIDNFHDVLAYPATGGTVNITNCGCAAQISAGTDASGNVVLYAIDQSGSLWENPVGAAGSLSASNWVSIGDCHCATEVSAGYNGVVYGVTVGDVWVNNLGSGTGWMQLSTGGLAKEISGGLDSSGANELWAISSAGQLFFNDTVAGSSASTTFFGVTTHVGPASRVSAGINGEAFTIENGQVVEYTDAATTPVVINATGDVVDLSAGANDTGTKGEIWFVHANGTLDVTSADTGGFTKAVVDGPTVNGAVEHVAATNDGTASYNLTNGNYFLAVGTGTGPGTVTVFTLDSTNEIL